MLTSLLALFGPMLIESIKDVSKAATTRFIGLSVDDQIKLADSDVRKLEAIAKMDNPYGTPSQWVVDLRAAFRYVAAAASILTGVFVIIYSITSITDALTAFAVAGLGGDLIGIPFAFIFGDRVRFNIQNFKK